MAECGEEFLTGSVEVVARRSGESEVWTMSRALLTSNWNGHPTKMDNGRKDGLRLLKRVLAALSSLT